MPAARSSTTAGCRSVRTNRTLACSSARRAAGTTSSAPAGPGPATVTRPRTPIPRARSPLSALSCRSLGVDALHDQVADCGGTPSDGDMPGRVEHRLARLLLLGDELAVVADRGEEVVHLRDRDVVAVHRRRARVAPSQEAADDG